MKNIIKLENWALGMLDSSGRLAFCGEVFNHPRFRDGDKITTSIIVGYDGSYFHTSSGSLYELGKVNDDYENQYPDAFNRVLKNCPRI